MIITDLPVELVVRHAIAAGLTDPQLSDLLDTLDLFELTKRTGVSLPQSDFLELRRVLMKDVDCRRELSSMTIQVQGHCDRLTPSTDYSAQIPCTLIVPSGENGPDNRTIQASAFIGFFKRHDFDPEPLLTFELESASAISRVSAIKQGAG